MPSEKRLTRRGSTPTLTLASVSFFPAILKATTSRWRPTPTAGRRERQCEARLSRLEESSAESVSILLNVNRFKIHIFLNASRNCFHFMTPSVSTVAGSRSALLWDGEGGGRAAGRNKRRRRWFIHRGTIILFPLNFFFFFNNASNYAP